MEEGTTELVLIKEERSEEDIDPQREMNTREERAGNPGGVCHSAAEKALLAALTAEERSGSRLHPFEALGGGPEVAAVDSALAILGGVTSSAWSGDVASGTLHAQRRQGEARMRVVPHHAQTGQRQNPAALSNSDPHGTKWPPLPSSDKSSLEADQSQAVPQRWRGLGNERFLCKYCGKGFRFAAKLRVHHRVHTGEKPYRCAHCGRGFSQSCSLTRHLNVHTGFKPFSCAQCGKAYTNKRSLKKHLAAHRGERIVV